MKKYIIIGLLLLFVGVMFIAPLFKGNDDDFSHPAEFSFKDNLATRWDEAVKLGIVLHSDEIEKLELIYNDSVFKTWENPTGKIDFMFNAGYYGLGTKTISLVSTLSDGSVESDDRMVRVLSDVTPQIWFAKPIGSFPHQESSYTQGLEFNNGTLYEGTGQYGQSMIAQVELSSGTINPNKNVHLDENYFGEGITVFGDHLYQLTWKEQKCFVYDKNTMQVLKEFAYNGEGWGLCNDGESIIMSDGTERITFRDPKTFTIKRSIDVYDDKGPFSKINELEYIDGEIYANQYYTNQIIVIDPLNGKVIAIINGEDVEKEGRGLGEVMNGIAYNPQTKKLYFTGKNWPKVLEINIEKPKV